MNQPLSVTILGSRGSVPVSGEKFSHYGGATCCILIRAGENALVLDAGTGLMNLSPAMIGSTRLTIFLTHCHSDHLLGLPLCPIVMNPTFRLDIYGATRDDQTISAQVDRLMSPPLWPVGPQQLPADIRFHELPPHIQLGDVLIESAEGLHPGGVSIFRISVGGKRIVYLTDCTITDDNRAFLADFSRNCDLLLCDGQYSDAQWPACSTFGHNRWTEASRFGKFCGAKMTRVLHHAPAHNDQTLDCANAEVRTIDPACALAFDGEEILI